MSDVTTSHEGLSASGDIRGHRSIAVAAAVNNDDVLCHNLGASPVFREEKIPLIAERGYSSAGRAYNHTLDTSAAEMIVFAHQDVYLPKGWFGRLQAAVEVLETRREKWAVLGIVGVDRHGVLVGRSWSNGQQMKIDAEVTTPTPVQSIDELVIVLHRTPGLRFDDDLPGFHLYGTDIVQSVIAAGLGAYVFDGPVVHNSLPVIHLDDSYRLAYRYMQRKWRAKLPIHTTIVPIMRFGWALFCWEVRSRIWTLRESPTTQRCASPARMAQELGYE